jgi:hypothetical protein
MNRKDAIRLDRYFENPPAGDWLASPTPFNPGVLGCSIEHQLAAAMMVARAKQEADRARQSAASRQRIADEIDLPEKLVDPALAGERSIPRVLIATQLPVKPKRNAKPVRFTPREFRQSLDPVLIAMTAEERNERVALYRTAAKMMWNGADWDDSLNIVSPKIMDQLLYMCERLLYSVHEALHKTGQEIKALQRQTMNDEIPRQQIERLEWRQAGLRVQERHFELMAYAFKSEHDLACRYWEGATGSKWGAYEGLKARKERSAREWRSKNRRRSSLSMVIENMSTEEFNQWVAKTQRYEPKLNGVEASDEEATPVDMAGWSQEDIDEHYSDQD